MFEESRRKGEEGGFCRKKKKEKTLNVQVVLSVSQSASQPELCSSHILHVKVACDVSQKHVRPRRMAETDVSCLCTEGEREGYVLSLGLICLLGQVLRGAGADTINLLLQATTPRPTSQNTGEHVGD